MHGNLEGIQKHIIYDLVDNKERSTAEWKFDELFELPPNRYLLPSTGFAGMQISTGAS